MSKPLTDEQKEKMWENIREALEVGTDPRPGEFTVKDMMEATGFKRNRVSRALNRLVEKEVLGKRQWEYKGSNIYYPIKEVSTEELLEMLSK